MTDIIKRSGVTAKVGKTAHADTTAHPGATASERSESAVRVSTDMSIGVRVILVPKRAVEVFLSGWVELKTQTTPAAD